MKNNNWNKWAKYAMIGLLAVALLLWVVIPAAEIVLGHMGGFLSDYIDKHPVGVFIAACVLGFVAYAATRPKAEAPSGKCLPMPTISDYFKILETVRPAVAEIASSLGLAPIDNHTDMAADGAERILRWGKVWGMKYKARKLSATTAIDVDRAKRVIQDQIKTVLDRDNPSKLTETNYNYYGELVPVIQVAEVKDDDAYIYVYICMASDVYFKQVEAEKRASTLHTQTDADDTDF